MVVKVTSFCFFPPQRHWVEDVCFRFFLSLVFVILVQGNTESC